MFIDEALDGSTMGVPRSVDRMVVGGGTVGGSDIQMSVGGGTVGGSDIGGNVDSVGAIPVYTNR